MEADYWHERWDSGRIRFDQAEANALLTERWPALGCPPGGTVFVPLCGKSIDMVWLRAEGHPILGNELSERAIKDFFAERRLDADEHTVGELTAHRADGYELWCGDFFDLSAADLADVVAVYDRASLVALPPEMRRRYADHLTAIVPPSAPILLIVFEYDQAEMDGPPFSVTDGEIAALYGAAFDIEALATVDNLAANPDLRERGLTGLIERVVALRRKAA